MLFNKYNKIRSRDNWDKYRTQRNLSSNNKTLNARLLARVIRDRPFNLKRGRGCYGFLFRSENYFRATRELEYNYMTKTKNSESDFFFFLHQNQNIFFSNIGNQNIFLEKNIPPLQVKWSFPNEMFEA
jgi:hypothetical protein